jgi:hypothetical protein
MTQAGGLVVDELVQAISEFLLPLRTHHGFDEELHGRVVRALHQCITEWKDLDCIPREAVNVLVSLEPSMLASADQYEPPLRERIVDEAIRIGELVIEAVAI